MIRKINLSFWQHRRKSYLQQLKFYYWWNCNDLWTRIVPLPCLYKRKERFRRNCSDFYQMRAIQFHYLKFNPLLTLEMKSRKKSVAKIILCAKIAFFLFLQGKSSNIPSTHEHAASYELLKRVQKQFFRVTQTELHATNSFPVYVV